MARADLYEHEARRRLIVSAAPEYLECYSRLRRLVGEEDRHVADLVIAHGLALEFSAHRALGGAPDPLQPIRALPHVTPEGS